MEIKAVSLGAQQMETKIEAVSLGEIKTKAVNPGATIEATTLGVAIKTPAKLGHQTDKASLLGEMGDQLSKRSAHPMEIKTGDHLTDRSMVEVGLHKTEGGFF
jgi:hypothetical protein